MRIAINLATRPFVELRPLFARLRIAMVALAVLAIGLGFGLHVLNARAKVATAQMDALRARTTAVEQQRTTNEARMKQPQNMGVLERSRFLNALFASKSFSWTAVMMDLERVLPGGVQVTSIEPVISKEGDVSIRLRVTGDRDKAIQLVRNLETSQRFMGPRLGGETSLTAEKASALGRAPAPGVRTVSADTDALMGNGVEFEIFSGYNPLPEKPAIKDAAAGSGKTAAKAKAPPAKSPVAKAPGAKTPAAKPKPSLPSARPAAVPAPNKPAAGVPAPGKPLPTGGAR